MVKRIIQSLMVGPAVLIGALSLHADANEGKYAAKELKELPPDTLSASVRESLSQSGYRVIDRDGKTVCDVWLRKELPILAKFNELLDLKYPIEPGTLVGAIRFPNDTSDYRKQAIKAAAYTLRYGHQPQDGNHLGTAQYRDFVIVGPASDDKSPETVTADKAIEMSTKVTRSTHPAILSLLPPLKRDTVPSMAHDDTLDLEVLVAKVAAKPGSTVKTVQIELVTVGHAPE